MTSIQQFMPHWRMRQVDHVAVIAHPDVAYEAVRAVDLYRLPLARGLFALRLLPEWIAALLGGQGPRLRPTATIEDITAPGNGFHLLSDGDHEVVVGAVGRFWQKNIEFADVDRETFAGYDHRGWGKLAWNIAVAPRAPSGSWITVDLRVDAGDEAAWDRFQRYWRLIGPFSHAIRRALMHRFAHDLGTPPPDDARRLVGDDLLPGARAQLTHAIDIEAPPDRVWPWLVQMGGRRAGWYSWDRLDNGGVPSADHIVPELQHLAVGDLIPATPHDTAGFEVLGVEPGRALVLGGGTHLYDGTWTFALEPIGDTATHLVTRYRAAYEPGPRMVLMRSALTPVHAFMERKQLRTLKQRAESAPRA